MVLCLVDDFTLNKKTELWSFWHTIAKVPTWILSKRKWFLFLWRYSSQLKIELFQLSADVFLLSKNDICSFKTTKFSALKVFFVKTPTENYFLVIKIEHKSLYHKKGIFFNVLPNHLDSDTKSTKRISQYTMSVFKSVYPISIYKRTLKYTPIHNFRIDWFQISLFHLSTLH